MPVGAEALQAFNELTSEVYFDMLRAPMLPPPLQPRRWSLPQLRQTVGEVQRRYSPTVQSYVTSLE
jgi:hypothetical protein